LAVGVRAIGAAQPTRASAERENERESTGMEQGAATAASATFECGARAAKENSCVFSDRHRC
jgi:hypothetical protein